MKTYVGLLFWTITLGVAFAHPPPGADPNSEIFKWFDRQVNTRGGGCCGEGDGHQLEDNQWRISGTNYQVNINDKWYTMENYMLLKGYMTDPNPTQHAIVWYSYDRTAQDGMRFYCFTPGYAT